VSGIGFQNLKIEGVVFDKVIELDNPKYGLLLEQEYADNLSILNEFVSK